MNTNHAAVDRQLLAEAEALLYFMMPIRGRLLLRRFRLLSSTLSCTYLNGKRVS